MEDQVGAEGTDPRGGGHSCRRNSHRPADLRRDNRRLQDFETGSEVQVGLSRFNVPPVGQLNIGLAAIGSSLDDLSCRLPRHSPVHLVLNRLEEFQAFRLGGVVINAGRVNIGDHLIKAAFRCADILDLP